MKNRKNNKGFSLVELIVVVAIMAVLVGVLAPAYLKYVENSRQQKDISAVGEVVNAIKIAAADEDVAQEITATGITVSVPKKGAVSTTATNLNAELVAILDDVELTAKDADAVTITVKTSTANDLIITVAGPAYIANAFS